MLTLTFPLPPVEQHFKAKPLRLISALLGHEGKGSLLSLLKAEDLAAGLSAGSGENTADYASLEIRVSLTPAGLRRYPEVVGKVLGAIEGLRRSGIPRYLFDEYRVMAGLEYRFREVGESSEEARQLSALMQSYPRSRASATTVRVSGTRNSRGPPTRPCWGSSRTRAGACRSPTRSYPGG
jgi:insulysin